jgi:hypothetical protein
MNTPNMNAAIRSWVCSQLSLRMEAPDTAFVLVCVRFAHRVGRFAITKPLLSLARPGFAVLVQGDRGYDVGVVEMIEHIPYMPTDYPFVVRAATCEEIVRMKANATYGKDTLLPLFRHVIATACDIFHAEGGGHYPLDSLKLVAVETQLDRTKVFVHFTADERVPHVLLAPLLYRLVRCRVWLNQLDYNATSRVPDPDRSANEAACVDPTHPSTSTTTVSKRTVLASARSHVAHASLRRVPTIHSIISPSLDHTNFPSFAAAQM